MIHANGTHSRGVSSRNCAIVTWKNLRMGSLPSRNFASGVATIVKVIIRYVAKAPRYGIRYYLNFWTKFKNKKDKDFLSRWQNGIRRGVPYSNCRTFVDTDMLQRIRQFEWCARWVWLIYHKDESFRSFCRQTNGTGIILELRPFSVDRMSEISVIIHPKCKWHGIQICLM